MFKLRKTERYSVSIQCLLFIMLLFLFAFENPLEGLWKGFGYFDEVIALITIPLLVIKYKDLDLKSLSILYLLIMFVAIGLSGNFLYNYQPWSIAFKDVLLNVKFWLVVIMGEYCGLKIDLKKNKKNILLFSNIVTFLFAILFVADNLLGLYTPIIRYGFRSTHLMFYHPTHFAAICVFMIALFLSFWDGYKSIIPIVILLLLLCSTLRSKAIAVAFAIVIIFYWAYKKNKKIKFRDVLLLLPLMVAIGWEQINWYFFSEIKSVSARNILLNSSIKIANSCFPFGAGHATFASYFSGVYYSPLYELLGISTINGLTPDDHSFMSDSFWPMIIGQNGYFGLLLFLLIVLIWVKKITLLRGYNKAYYTAGFVIVAYLIISSIAESSFVNPMTMPVAFWSGVLLGDIKRVRKCEKT